MCSKLKAAGKGSRGDEGERTIRSKSQVQVPLQGHAESSITWPHPKWTGKTSQCSPTAIGTLWLHFIAHPVLRDKRLQSTPNTRKCKPRK
ncbi:Ergothioneine biosynthesis protein 1 [Venturia inaequalis]|nr:Ergothioneine biosynthesis protein 1 [Venturia inaequalis]